MHHFLEFLRHVIEWIKRPNNDHRTLDEFLKNWMPDADRRFYAQRQKDFVMNDNLLFLKTTPTNNQETDDLSGINDLW